MSDNDCELDQATAGRIRPEEGNSDLLLDLKKRTLALMEGLKLVCDEHGMPSHMIINLRDQLWEYLKEIPAKLLIVESDLSSSCSELDIELSDFSDEEDSEAKCSAERMWVEECKYLLTYPMAKYLKNSPPKKPLLGGFKPKGALKRWMKARLNAFNPKNTHLWYSWFQAKRACDPFSRDVVKELFFEHREALSSEDPYWKSPSNTLSVFDIMSDRCFQMVLKAVSEKVADTYVNRWTGAKTNAMACYEQTRSTGGKIKALRKAAFIHDIPFSPTFSGSCLHSMREVPHRFCDGRIRHGIVEERITDNDWEGWQCLERFMDEKRVDYKKVSFANHDEYCQWYANMEDADVIGVIPRFSRSGLEMPAQKIRQKGFCFRSWIEKNPPPLLEFKKPEDGMLKCEVACVLEPNKGRMVSKGEAVPYYIMKPLQESLLSAIQSFPCFKLTGREFCATDIYNLLEMSREDYEWHSVDYSAATDNLSWEYSKKILEAVTSALPKKYRKLAEKVLGPHRISYPCDAHVGTFDQTNGQLMGSILSFPILCLANLGLYLQCTKDWQSDWSYHRRLNHVLVNGDDMLYSSPKTFLNSENKEISLWERHVRFGEAVGLKMSPGKAYHHRVYMNINSVSVLYDLGKLKTEPRYEMYPPWSQPKYQTLKLFDRALLYGKGLPSPRRLEFLNVGLVLNRHKVQGRSDEGKTDQQEADDWVWNKLKRMKKDLSENEFYEMKRYLRYSYDKYFGLDEGFAKLYAESHTHEDSRKGICENIPLALKGCWDEASKRRILAFILTYHKDEIARQTTFPATDCSTGRKLLFQRNLFLPLSLGGMGIDPPVGFRYKINSSQDRFARNLICGIGRESIFYSHRPLNRGVVPEIVPIEIEMEPWMKPNIDFFKEPGFISGLKTKSFVRRSLMGFFGRIPVYDPGQFVSREEREVEIRSGRAVPDFTFFKKEVELPPRSYRLGISVEIEEMLAQVEEELSYHRFVATEQFVC